MIAGLSALATPSCMTKREGGQIRGDLTSLRRRMDELDKLDAERLSQVAELKILLDHATALLTANTSTVADQEAKAEADLAVLDGRVEEMVRSFERQGRQDEDEQSRLVARLDALDRSEARIADRVEPLLPEGKDDLWTEAGKRLATGQRDEGRRFYRVFIQRFPEDPRASRAYLELGLSLLRDKQFPQAAAEFQRLLDTYPRAPEVPDAVWQLSQAFSRLRFCSDARALLRDLVKRFPRSVAASEAHREMKTMKKTPRAECTS